MNQSKFKYRLILLRIQPNSRVITRQVLDSNGKDTGEVSVHKHPFDDACFQRIESHLNPFFALAHARREINKGGKQDAIDLTELVSRQKDGAVQLALQSVLRITLDWEAPETIPAKFRDERSARFRPPTPTPTTRSRRSGTTTSGK